MKGNEENIIIVYLYDFKNIIEIIQKVKDLPVTPKDTKEPTRFQKILINSLWFISTARNILVVVFCALGCYLLEERLGSSPVILTGFVKPGLPSFEPPSFTTVVGNETYYFGDTVAALGSGCIVVPLLGILESIALSKVFCEYWNRIG